MGARRHHTTCSETQFYRMIQAKKKKKENRLLIFDHGYKMSSQIVLFAFFTPRDGNVPNSYHLLMPFPTSHYYYWPFRLAATHQTQKKRSKKKIIVLIKVCE